MVRRQYTEEDSPYVPRGERSSPSQANQGLKSTPRYNPLQWQENAQHHHIFALGSESFDVIKILLSQADKIENVTIHLCIDDTIDKPQWEHIDSHQIHIISQVEGLLAKADHIFQHSLMGDVFYIACPEMYIWKIYKESIKYGILREQFQMWHVGSAMRSVYCCHCNTTHDNVTSNIFQCDGCNQMIFIYDHFSRSNASYLGFRVDAETPNDYPEPEKHYT